MRGREREGQNDHRDIHIDILKALGRQPTPGGYYDDYHQGSRQVNWNRWGGGGCNVKDTIEGKSNTFRIYSAKRKLVEE